MSAALTTLADSTTTIKGLGYLGYGLSAIGPGIGIGYLVGFRFNNGFWPAIAMIGLAIALGFAVCLISAAIPFQKNSILIRTCPADHLPRPRHVPFCRLFV